MPLGWRQPTAPYREERVLLGQSILVLFLHHAHQDSTCDELIAGAAEHSRYPLLGICAHLVAHSLRDSYCCCSARARWIISSALRRLCS